MLSSQITWYHHYHSHQSKYRSSLGPQHTDDIKLLQINLMLITDPYPPLIQIQKTGQQKRWQKRTKTAVISRDWSHSSCRTVTSFAQQETCSNTHCCPKNLHCIKVSTPQLADSSSLHSSVRHDQFLCKMTATSPTSWSKINLVLLLENSDRQKDWIISLITVLISLISLRN